MPIRLKKSDDFALIFNNLIELCNQKNTSVTTLLKEFTNSTSAMEAWKNGNINANIIPKLALKLDTSLDYLLTGKEKSSPLETLSKEEQKILKYFKELPHDEQQQIIGMTILLKEQISQQKHIKDETVEDEPNVVWVRYNPDFRVSAGLGDELPDYQQWGKAKVLKTLESQKADFILTVDGDSMEPKFYSGNLVLVKQQPNIDDGLIGIFRLNGEGYIKKKQGNKLISLNQKYPEITIRSEDYKCFGLVLGTTEIIDYI